eukprot:TRINITY_DN13523_c0_g2_i1.p1 TRINITY_DN13523_c0_g2~~TRINITY_DN13523_c0_g2_i1.p1  ORF type:complete len:360 (-),score=42.11 TRINITY_DN13523_c0_g2_i1:384-1370(-)
MNFSSILDELMGKERNVPLNQRSGRAIKFSDPEVCKYQLCGLCPYKLFKNTKSDLGACGYEFHEDHIEWDEVQKDWDRLKSREKARYGYERDLCRFLESLIRDMDRKIEKAQERAAQESIPKEMKPEEQSRLDEIKQKEKDAQEKAEKLAEEGDIDASMMFTQQAEQFKTQYEALHKQLTFGDKTMEVCTVCGVFINSTDNDQRRQDHLNGKQYQGWKKIRAKRVELEALLKKQREQEEEEEEARYRPRRREDSESKYEDGERERSLSTSSYKRKRSLSPGGRRSSREDYYDDGYSKRRRYDRRDYDRGNGYDREYGVEKKWFDRRVR